MHEAADFVNQSDLLTPGTRVNMARRDFSDFVLRHIPAGGHLTHKIVIEQLDIRFRLGSLGGGQVSSGHLYVKKRQVHAAAQIGMLSALHQIGSQP